MKIRTHSFRTKKLEKNLYVKHFARKIKVSWNTKLETRRDISYNVIIYVLKADREYPYLNQI